MPIPFDEVINQLRAFGGAPVGEFVQAARRRNTELGPLASRVSRGFCQGACLDWIRRVLQHGSAAYSGDAPHVERQTRRMAFAHVAVTHESSTAAALVTDPIAKLLTAYNDAIDKRQKTVTLDEPAVRALTLNAPLPAPVSPGVYKASEILVLLDNLEQTANTPPALRAQMWKARLTYLDSRTQTKRRHFSGIELAGSAGPDWYGGVPAALETFFGLVGFVRGTALQINFDMVEKDGTETGHMVALHRVSAPEGRDHLFDPNFGMFDLPVRGARSAVEYLFGTVYQQDGCRVVVGGQCKAQAELFRASAS